MNPRSSGCRVQNRGDVIRSFSQMTCGEAAENSRHPDAPVSRRQCRDEFRLTSFASLRPGVTSLQLVLSLTPVRTLAAQTFDLGFELALLAGERAQGGAGGADVHPRREPVEGRQQHDPQCDAQDGDPEGRHPLHVSALEHDSLCEPVADWQQDAQQNQQDSNLNPPPILPSIVEFPALIGRIIVAMSDPRRAMQLCERALHEAFAFASEAVLDWVVRLERVAALWNWQLA